MINQAKLHLADLIKVAKGEAPADLVIVNARVVNTFTEEIEYGEELGFESVWLPEHHLAIYGMLGST